MESNQNELAELLESVDGIKALISIAKDASADEDTQANAFGLLEDNGANAIVSKEIVSSELVDSLLSRLELEDTDEGLHLPMWRCLAAWANSSVSVARCLWKHRSQLIRCAFTLRHASLSTTTLVCATITCMVRSLRKEIRPSQNLLLCGLIDDSVESFCDLMKQFYVFGGNVGCIDLFCHLVSTKTEIKAVFSTGLVRIWARDWIVEEKRESEFGPKWTELLLRLVIILHPNRSLLYSGTDAGCQWASAMCSLALSPHKFVWMEMVSLISDILANGCTKQLFMAHPHACGVISWLLTKNEALSDVIRTDFENTVVVLSSLNKIGLPELPIGLTLAEALEAAISYKDKGNRWFGMGNYPAARQFYRVALSTLKVAETSTLRQLNNSNSIDMYSIGARVKVRQADGTIKLAMVSDDPSDGKLEVIYDCSGEDDIVSLRQCSLCLSLKDQEKLASLQILLCMNQAKCLAHLRMVNEAIECLTFGLQAEPEHLPGLYLRGLLSLQSMQLKQAKEDFYKANSLAIKLKDKATQAEIHRAWKKLKILTAQRKKADKKLIKEMMAYLDTIAIES